MLNIIIQMVLLSYMCLLYFSKSIPNYMDKDFIIKILVLNLIALFSFVFIRREKIFYLKNQYLRISFLFLISFCIVNFQAYLDFIFGYLRLDNTFIWIDASIVSISLVISSIGLVSFLLGYSLLNNKNINLKKKYADQIVDTKVLNSLALFFLITFFATVNLTYINGNYGVESMGSVAGYSAFLFECIIYSSIILNCRNLLMLNKIQLNFIDYLKEIKYSILMLIIYFITVMFSGDRGPIIFLSLGVVFGYVYVTKKKISIFKLLIFITIGSLFITTLGIIRKIDNNHSFFQNLIDLNNENLENTYYPNSIFNNTKELAGSVRTVHLAVSTVPSKVEHFNGFFAFMDLLLIIPSANSSFISLIGLNKVLSNSAEFLTFIDMGNFPRWGIGTSCIADTYLDFGGFGIIVVFFIFGFVIRRLELVAFSNSIGSLALIICVFLFFSYSVYIPRATILYGLSRFLYVFIFCYLAILLKRKRV